eukprot:TRINITY_DN28076_c0_g1_i1.p1 TRINITY_DN28076_c0_g1~~TRINITY_DN28076_c0_g1_i1.p1  ORF type:complete len:324 (-),score=33.27 TRINITY_DN28076_c0_g1_i1:52-927(-)
MRSHASVLFLAWSALAAGENNTGHSVLVFGDSWGALGPSYREVQDTFNRHGVAASVLSTAVSGSSACGWAAQDEGMALVKSVRSTFPNLPNGPDFVWYTAGGNDLAYSSSLKACAGQAKQFEDMVACLKSTAQEIMGCTETLLNNLWKAYPNVKVMHSGYDLPCENALCDYSIVGLYEAGWCGSNHACINALMEQWHKFYVGGLMERYADKPQYTGLNILGTCQKAGGVAGADVGKPVLSQGSPCQWEVVCIHPEYGSPAGIFVGEAMWELYFSLHVQPNSTSSGAKPILV